MRGCQEESSLKKKNSSSFIWTKRPKWRCLVITHIIMFSPNKINHKSLIPPVKHGGGEMMIWGVLQPQNLLIFQSLSLSWTPLVKWLTSSKVSCVWFIFFFLNKKKKKKPVKDQISKLFFFKLLYIRCCYQFSLRNLPSVYFWTSFSQTSGRFWTSERIPRPPFPCAGCLLLFISSHSSFVTMVTDWNHSLGGQSVILFFFLILYYHYVCFFLLIDSMQHAQT